MDSEFEDLDSDYRNLFAEECKIGISENGATDRMALSENDSKQRHYFENCLKLSGARIVVDPIGNIFGLFEWNDNSKFIIIGSHLDSQENGGLFDGAYGVISALAVAKKISRGVRAGGAVPKFNLAVVDWTNEEGSRFEPSVMGSRVFTGALKLEDALNSRDEKGIRLGDELKSRRWNGATFWKEPVSAFVEVHVEQGMALSLRHCDIGLVTGNWAAVKLDILVEGEQSHTGATEMCRRKDALYGAALVICAAKELSNSYDTDVLRTSVTKMHTFPHSPNIITAHCTLHIEIRSEQYDVANDATQKLIKMFEELAIKSNTKIQIRNIERREAMSYPGKGISLSEKIADRMGLTHMRMKTVSGHDSVAINKKIPTIMLFVPSSEGYAHSPKEFTDQNSQIKGLHELFGVTSWLLYNDSSLSII